MEANVTDLVPACQSETGIVRSQWRKNAAADRANPKRVGGAGAQPAGPVAALAKGRFGSLGRVLRYCNASGSDFDSIEPFIYA